MAPFRVEAYAAHMYPQRPEWVVWQGQRHRVQAIEAAWREPGCLRFRVRLDDGQRLLLSYREHDDTWAALPAAPPFGGQRLA